MTLVLQLVAVGFVRACHARSDDRLVRQSALSLLDGVNASVRRPRLGRCWTVVARLAVLVTLGSAIAGLASATTTTGSSGSCRYDVAAANAQESGGAASSSTTRSRGSEVATACDVQSGPAIVERTATATNSADDVAGLADEAFGAGDAMASRYLKPMSDSPVDIPQGWAPRVADNGKGVVFQRPGATGNADMIRVDDSGAAATTSRRTHDIDEQRGSERTRTRPR